MKESSTSHPPLEIHCTLNKEMGYGIRSLDHRAKHSTSADAMLPPQHVIAPSLALQTVEGDHRAKHSASADAMLPPHLSEPAPTLRAVAGHADYNIGACPP